MVEKLKCIKKMDADKNSSNELRGSKKKAEDENLVVKVEFEQLIYERCEELAA
ncbi:MAG: hypothetical protein AB1765_05285 [Candidatus Hydrogenedentota bacterium]